jgi:hypothetical protein
MKLAFYHHDAEPTERTGEESSTNTVGEGKKKQEVIRFGA